MSMTNDDDGGVSLLSIQCKLLFSFRSDDDDVGDVCLQAFSSRCWGGRFNETIQIII